MTTDWRRWHGYYDDPARSLSRRLGTVRDLLARTARENAHRAGLRDVEVRTADAGTLVTSGHQGDPSDLVREVFARYGYAEEAFVRPDDASYRVGVHRRTSRVRLPGDTADPVLFSFTR